MLQLLILESLFDDDQLNNLPYVAKSYFNTVNIDLLQRDVINIIGALRSEMHSGLFHVF